MLIGQIKHSAVRCFYITKAYRERKPSHAYWPLWERVQFSLLSIGGSVEYRPNTGEYTAASGAKCYKISKNKHESKIFTITVIVTQPKTCADVAADWLHIQREKVIFFPLIVHLSSQKCGSFPQCKVKKNYSNFESWFDGKVPLTAVYLTLFGQF